jgi:acetyl esterase/lipase
LRKLVITSFRLITGCVAAAGLFAAPAHAAPPPTELSVPVAPTDLSSPSLGISTLRVTYTWNAAAASAKTPGLTLAQGSMYRIYTCIRTHVHGRNFATKCGQKDVDTRSKALPTVTAGPTVTASSPRPAAGQWGYAYLQVVVHERGADGAYKHKAGTPGGLSLGAVPLPPEGSWTGLLPGLQGVTYPGAGVGGLNTGAPDSMCVGIYKGGGTPSGLSTSALGTGAPAYYEVGEPTTGNPARGVMLVVHGGGWKKNGPGFVAEMRKDADRWRARGWRTVSISYRPCERAFADVKWFYDRVRAVYGAGLPYCALGASAGGNLVLVLATQRPNLACVINQSGPTNAKALVDQEAYDPISGSSVVGPRWLFNTLTAAVGQETTHWYSPANFPISARVLSAFTARDTLVPLAQATELQSKMHARNPQAYSEVVNLEHGSAATFVHAPVSQAALDDYYARERELVAPLEH